MKVIIDTNCLLDAADKHSIAYPYLQNIFVAASVGKVKLWISLHSLSEINKTDAMTKRAKEIAGGLNILPHYPIGVWGEQVGTWDNVSGTWGDAERNQELQTELASLAKAGNSIRDRGAYIDAINAHADVFVTSDRQLAGSGPAERIRQRFFLRVITPKALAEELST